MLKDSTSKLLLTKFNHLLCLYFPLIYLTYVCWCFRGNGASVIRIVPYAALHFMAYEQYRCLILNNYHALGSGPLIDLLAGAAAGGTAVLCTYPLDLARTKLAYQVFILHNNETVCLL